MTGAALQVALTGATGFLGPHLVESLKQRGIGVTVLARDPDRARAMLPAVDHILACDLSGHLPDSLATALQGCTAVIHAAGGYQASLTPGADLDRITKLNTTAAVALWDIADAAGLGRFITLGSAATVGRDPSGGPGDETAPVAAVTSQIPYLSAKLAMPGALAARAARSSMALIEVLPGSLWGPGGRPGSAPYKMVDDFRNGRIPGILPGGAMIVDVRDVAEAIAGLVTHPAPQDRYILGGRRVELGELFQLLARETGAAAPTRRIPALLARLISRLKPEKLPPNTLRMLLAGTLVTSDRAAADLRFAPRPLQETIAATATSLDESCE
jgi:dihydroflavonol-4-reductase